MMVQRTIAKWGCRAGADSDLIALLPSHCIPAAFAQTLVTLPVPMDIEEFSLYLGWHKRRETDPGTRHVITCIQQSLPTLEVPVAAWQDSVGSQLSMDH